MSGIILRDAENSDNIVLSWHYAVHMSMSTVQGTIRCLNICIWVEYFE